jgi:heptosyltransferase-1
MPATESPKRILLVKLSAIGDVLMATPVAKALRTAFPDSYIAWAVERKSADVVLGNPYLDEVYVIDRPKGEGFPGDGLRYAGSLMRFRREMRARRFDVCLDMQGLLRSGLVSWLSGAKVRGGFADADEGSAHFYHKTYVPESADLNAQQRNLNLLRLVGVNSTDTAMHMPITEHDRAFVTAFFSETGLDGHKTVALCPATTWANKHWVTERWSEVADLLADKYGVRSVIMGSKANAELAARIADGARAKPVLSVGRTSLKQAGAIMERCDAVIGVDTGLLHMAVALDRPTVGLFGASAFHCFTRKSNFVWVYNEFECSPCYRHPTCKNVDCMRSISAEDVDKAVGRWLT